MATEQQKQIEREWIAAAAERDDLRAEVQAARQSGDAQALATARIRVRAATNRCNEIMFRYQRSLGVAPPPPPPKPSKPAPPPPDTRKLDAARAIVEDLADLIGKADAAGLAPIARTMIAARDAARRVMEPRGGGRSVG